MSREPVPVGDDQLSTEQAVRAMLLALPRLVSRAKRTPMPERLRSLHLAPRHLSLLSFLLFDGPTPVRDLAAGLEVAPTTVSLMVSDLERQGVVRRHADPEDRRRTIVALTGDPETREAIDAWLAAGARAWRKVFDGLTPGERATFVRAIQAYEAEVAAARAD
ncbi:MarR family winged helix-turn-helix transcriptional regulator [Streptomyces marincola]|uniref:MarR family winged helix-turn-helix transcriptional regulator n=1 Tax=Streptomyces marincola TaxID=2878388 RepID=UPI001CF1EF26|nr:MarR family winged helix-turn-helix transcriptional regulator [Streptomyces marincola]UCM88197.1 MarR family winged helix-turn-helix transcriptional regulator [Streptomyces marincola]